jgi:hypothetical protein
MFLVLILLFVFRFMRLQTLMLRSSIGQQSLEWIRLSSHGRLSSVTA